MFLRQTQQMSDCMTSRWTSDVSVLKLKLVQSGEAVHIERFTSCTAWHHTAFDAGAHVSAFQCVSVRTSLRVLVHTCRYASVGTCEFEYGFSGAGV